MKNRDKEVNEFNETILSAIKTYINDAVENVSLNCFIMSSIKDKCTFKLSDEGFNRVSEYCDEIIEDINANSFSESSIVSNAFKLADTLDYFVCSELYD